jgi:hypothetical protein
MKNRASRQSRKRLILIFCLSLLFFLFLITLRDCKEEPPLPVWHEYRVTIETTVQEDTGEVDTVEGRDTVIETAANTSVPDTSAAVESKDTSALQDPSVEESTSADSLFVYADPWGGRHFDSITVRLFCRETCLVLFSLEDSLNLTSYSDPIKIRRSKTLWIAGVNKKGEQSDHVRIKYVIEKKRGRCPENMKPFEINNKSVCMDMYEWPNKEGEQPAPYVTRREAVDSCATLEKRLCTLKEWQTVCTGPEHYMYPYGNDYNENYCPAKEKTARRSGRFPVCRSYYGTYDMPGNLWEWTSTESREREGFYMVTGGNWNTGDQATCMQTKYSFFPQNKYLFVGFRCCSDVE